MVRQRAVEALGGIGSAAKAAVPMLTALLKDNDAGVRGDAAFALRRIASRADTVSTLIALLKDKDAAVRWRAARSLGRIGPTAKDAVPVLTELRWEDEDLDVRHRAREALDQIEPSDRGGG